MKFTLRNPPSARPAAACESPSAVSSGSAQRLVIVDGLAWAQQTMNIQRTSKRPDTDPQKLPGWVAPPVTLGAWSAGRLTAT